MAGMPVEIVVFGIGNVLHGDDGAGVYALERLKKDLRVGRGVRLVDGGTLGLELLDYARGGSHLLFLDAVDAGQEPGTLVRLRGSRLGALRTKGDVHQLGIADLLGALRLVSRRRRAIVLIGVQPSSTDWGTALTEPVHAALPQMVEAAVEQLERWGQRTRRVVVPQVREGGLRQRVGVRFGD